MTNNQMNNKLVKNKKWLKPRVVLSGIAVSEYYNYSIKLAKFLDLSFTISLLIVKLSFLKNEQAYVSI